VQNALLALAALDAAGFHDTPKIDEAIARTVVPGRFQVAEKNGRVLVFDVGHNPAAAQAFTLALKRRFPGQTICLVTGVMKDKDVAGIMRQYASVARSIIVTKPTVERAADCETLLRAIPEDFRGGRSAFPHVGEAVAEAMGGREDIVCVAGSFHTVGEAMEAMGIEPYGR
jgi:dihydrofolate synthase/folylpolyglutamate synthase